MDLSLGESSTISENSKSLKNLEHLVKDIGLNHSENSKSRSLSHDVSQTISLMDKMEDRDLFEKYFLKIFDLISNYKKSHFSLKRLSQIIDRLVKKDINVAKEQMEDIISIIEHPKFDDKYKRKLIFFLISEEDNNIDLDTFFEETKMAYAEFEESFTIGKNSPFKEFTTTPHITIELAENFSIGETILCSEEFNKLSDIGKIIKIINFITKCNIDVDPNHFITTITKNLLFNIKFDFDNLNIKADLKLKESLIHHAYEHIPTIIAESGSYVEVKYKNYLIPSYLSEFFKVDSSDKSYELMCAEFLKSHDIVDSKSAVHFLMKGIAENLSDSLNRANGKQILNHLTKNLSGLIFEENIFIKKNDIQFYWNTKGYANRSRLSLWYSVNDDAKIWKLCVDKSNNFTKFVARA